MTQTPNTEQLRRTVQASLFAALIAAGAFLAVPIGPVPIVLQNMFVLLAGLLLGPRWGLAGVGIYLLAGAIGLPVFAGGTGGIGRMLGPTGGYLLAYLPAVWIVGIVSRKAGGRVMGDVVAMSLGALVIYAMGVPYLKVVTGMSWSRAAAVGMLPFLIGDVLKIAAAVPIARTLRPMTVGRLASHPADGYSRG
ncbi:biotin transporter BioY [Desulfococcus multivorans]|jgi:biotin transport system substrate-specific component|uniref:Biotin transporter n=1 Tax=Desulfococcus multivorans DSM 2059 TaxID=1121405 RepID=S7TGQ0_DESML|nr:biotin transporter BioY [Desulfococcus multivorans]AOY59969.1 BioY family protein [Desulfococcus multivorans]AQV02116.1 BioY family transporter [Desulfococcus multivorans]EPR35966.1 BioY protein [Desulfococcus multivorans DSM 2059]MDX9819128.1 biotin transporter BioY [Desulfococcus multivorans]SJZ36001.1 biotin transport system substrate-specific component [Desulfococcus multivorans DSM 2059]